MFRRSSRDRHSSECLQDKRVPSQGCPRSAVSLNKIRTQTRENFKKLFAFLVVDNLTALVGSLRVDAMRNFRLARILVQVELRRFQSIMSAALARARFRMSSFWIWHLLKPLFFDSDLQFAI